MKTPMAGRRAHSKGFCPHEFSMEANVFRFWTGEWLNSTMREMMSLMVNTNGMHTSEWYNRLKVLQFILFSSLSNHCLHTFHVFDERKCSDACIVRNKKRDNTYSVPQNLTLAVLVGQTAIIICNNNTEERTEARMMNSVDELHFRKIYCRLKQEPIYPRTSWNIHHSIHNIHSRAKTIDSIDERRN